MILKLIVVSEMLAAHTTECVSVLSCVEPMLMSRCIVTESSITRIAHCAARILVLLTGFDAAEAPLAQVTLDRHCATLCCLLMQQV